VAVAYTLHNVEHPYQHVHVLGMLALTHMMLHTVRAHFFVGPDEGEEAATAAKAKTKTKSKAAAASGGGASASASASASTDARAIADSDGSTKVTDKRKKK
jgi:hypothetical protein